MVLQCLCLQWREIGRLFACQATDSFSFFQEPLSFQLNILTNALSFSFLVLRHLRRVYVLFWAFIDRTAEGMTGNRNQRGGVTIESTVVQKGHMTLSHMT